MPPSREGDTDVTAYDEECDSVAACHGMSWHITAHHGVSQTMLCDQCVSPFEVTTLLETLAGTPPKALPSIVPMSDPVSVEFIPVCLDFTKPRHLC